MLYLDPDTLPPPSPSVDSPALGGASQAAADHVAADSSPYSGGAPGSLSPTSSAADVIPARLSEGARHHVDTGSNRLQTFVDSDYAAVETRRSTMGGTVMLDGGPISWFSILGKTVATCTSQLVLD